MLSERGDKRRERDADDMNHYSHFIHLLIFRAASDDKKKAFLLLLQKSFHKKTHESLVPTVLRTAVRNPPPPLQHTQTYTHTSVNSTQPLLWPGNRHRHYSDYIAKGWIGRRTGGGVDSNNVSNYLACKHEFMQRVRFCWCGSRRTAHQQARAHTEALPARVLRESSHT